MGLVLLHELVVFRYIPIHSGWIFHYYIQCLSEGQDLTLYISEFASLEIESVDTEYRFSNE